MSPDPFRTGELRASTLAAWASSPTRLREDTATEADLVRGGYRDRVLTELAQNAADAAARAGVSGELRVELVRGEVRVANTGAPLDAPGVQALAALRASSKVGGVGRFGVGFTAVLSVTDEPRVLSRTGSVGFSAARTRAELGKDGDVPTLRLVWPVDEAPSADTEVVLPLRDGVDGAALVADFLAQAPELLLELHALQAITVAGTRIERHEVALGPGVGSVEVGGRAYLQARGRRARWLARIVGGQVRPAGPDVLRAPTRTDEELSLPALVVADVELAPDRRRILPGATLDGLADGYVALVTACPPAQRTRLVPLPGFPRSPVDEELRAQVLRALAGAAWLPGAGGTDQTPGAAVVLDVEAPELVELLADVVPGLLVAELSGREHGRALAAVGVGRLGLAGVADAVAGLGREPAWWRRLYAALAPHAGDRVAFAELAAVPVPLVDGRTVLGARGALVATTPVAVPGVRVVHPDAVHPLLERLGAVPAGPRALLEHPALRAALADDDIAPTVLALVRAAAPEPGTYPWLGELLLEDGTGELRAADELLAPGAPLASMLVADSPFGTVAEDVVAEWGLDTVRAVGVGWGFTILIDEEATGPEHDLDDEDRWWAECRPERVVAVRDLELVDERRWVPALELLQRGGRWDDRGGYTEWWLRRHARLPGPDGQLHPLGHFRAEDDSTYAGLLDAVAVPVGPALLAGPLSGEPGLAELVLRRLGDPGRAVGPAVAARAYAALAHADVEPPPQVRARDGSVVDTADALVLDGAWWAQVVPAARQVVGRFGDDAVALAELLDAGLASEEVAARVIGEGRALAWGAMADAVLMCASLGVEVPAGVVRLHGELRVRVDGVSRAVDWWVDDVTVHVGAAGTAAALAHVLGLS